VLFHAQSWRKSFDEIVEAIMIQRLHHFKVNEISRLFEAMTRQRKRYRYLYWESTDSLPVWVGTPEKRHPPSATTKCARIASLQTVTLSRPRVELVGITLFEPMLQSIKEPTCLNTQKSAVAKEFAWVPSKRRNCVSSKGIRCNFHVSDAGRFSAARTIERIPQMQLRMHTWKPNRTC
jgi:hypothetical protein